MTRPACMSMSTTMSTYDDHDDDYHHDHDYGLNLGYVAFGLGKHGPMRTLY